MQVINSRGRVLMEVTRQYRNHVQDESQFDYVQPGNGAGYGLSIVEIDRAIRLLKADIPSAQVHGFLPQCELLCDCMDRLVSCPKQLVETRA